VELGQLDPYVNLESGVAALRCTSTADIMAQITQFSTATFTTHLSTTQALATAATIKVLVHETTPMWLHETPHLPAGLWTCIHPRSRPLSCPDNTTQLYKGQSLKSLLKNLRPEQNEHVFSYLAKTKDCAFYTVRLKSRSNWVQNV
jgi:hypothetical protein